MRFVNPTPRNEPNQAKPNQSDHNSFHRNDTYRFCIWWHLIKHTHTPTFISTACCVICANTFKKSVIGLVKKWSNSINKYTIIIHNIYGGWRLKHSIGAECCKWRSSGIFFYTKRVSQQSYFCYLLLLYTHFTIKSPQIDIIAPKIPINE